MPSGSNNRTIRIKHWHKQALKSGRMEFNLIFFPHMPNCKRWICIPSAPFLLLSSFLCSLLQLAGLFILILRALRYLDLIPATSPRSFIFPLISFPSPVLCFASHRSSEFAPTLRAEQRSVFFCRSDLSGTTASSLLPGRPGPELVFSGLSESLTCF